MKRMGPDPLCLFVSIRFIRRLKIPMAQFPDEQSEDGEFKRQPDAFRDWVTADGSSPYAPVAGRYHLYISLACPWASRTFIVRHLKGLESAVTVTVADPIRD